MKRKNNSYEYNLLLMVKSLFVIGMAICFVNCSKEPTYAESLIKVDSLTISYPETLLYSGLFEINVYGTISYNGCSSFSRFNISRKNQDVIIEAWKNVQVNANVCPTVMVYLNHKILCNRDSLPENFTIKVKQPDGTYLEKTMKW
jgi:hypothetical protein